MSTFINPYHFLPPGKAVGSSSVDDVLQSLSQAEATNANCPELLHDRLLPSFNGKEYYSGTIRCRLTTRSPCVFGNHHRKVRLANATAESETTIVDNFELNGEPAIAGTSLKGVLSSMAEMASGSGMRVLKNAAMSIRSTMGQSRSAVGMIFDRTVKLDNGRTSLQRYLLPLTLPNFSLENQNWKPVGQSGTMAVWKQLAMKRAGLTKAAVYINRKTANDLCFHNGHSISELPSKYQVTIGWEKGRPTKAQNEDTLKGGKLLRPLKDKDSIPSPTSFSGSPECFPGIVRSLNSPNGTAEPQFDLFIPIESEWISDQHAFRFDAVSSDLLLSCEDACTAFDVIVGHPDSTLREDPIATTLSGQSQFTRSKGGSSGEVPSRQLRQGDLVYFEPKDAQTVRSVSVSAIWRQGVRWLWNEALNDFSLLGDPERRPLTAGRTTVSAAEKLFGWVFDSSREAYGANSLPNGYRGRVTVTDAVRISENESETSSRSDYLINRRDELGEPLLKGYFPLRILGQPQLPCPEFYFSSTGTKKGIRHALMSGSDKVHMQGRKFYWIHSSTLDKDDYSQWTTKKPKENLKQKSWVKPIRCGVQFEFDINFKNLTELELELLTYCLAPKGVPCDQNVSDKTKSKDPFLHHVGFGKSLGLGAVSIQPFALSLSVNGERYCKDEQLLQKSNEVSLNDFDYLNMWATEYAEKIGPHHRLICAMSQHAKATGKRSVSYPICEGQTGEDELFKWFSANRDDKEGDVKAVLAPLADDGPTSLESHKHSQ